MAIRDTIMSFNFMTPPEMAIHIAKAAQAMRLSLNLSQRSLSERSGVSFGVIKKFERTGKISLESLLKLALVLGKLENFMLLFKPTEPKDLPSLDHIMKDDSRKRGRG
jgi:transcriptional regulator with XRE-family HTH domain